MANISNGLLSCTFAFVFLAIATSQSQQSLKTFLNAIHGSPAVPAQPQARPIYSNQHRSLVVEPAAGPVVTKGNIIIAAPPDSIGNGGNNGGGSNNGGSDGGKPVAPIPPVTGGNTGGRPTKPRPPTNNYHHYDPFRNFVDTIGRSNAFKRIQCMTIPQFYGIHNFPPTPCANSCPYSYKCMTIDPYRRYSAGYCCPYYVTEYMIQFETMMSSYGLFAEYLS